MRLGLVLTALLLTTRIVSAQEDSLTVEVANFAEREGSAQAVVTTLDAEGLPLPGLTAENFRARVNGTEAPVTSVTRGQNSEVGISVVLTLDTSSSMQGAFLEQAKAAAKQFLQGLRPQDSVAVVKFSTGVQTVTPFTQNKAAAAAAIDQLVADGATTLYQATMDSTSIAAASGGTRRAVVLLSDGLNFGGAATREDALADVGTAGVPFFVIGLGAELDRDYLNELAESTGGQFAETPGPEGLTLLYQSVSELLRNQYILGLDTTALELDVDEPTAVVVDVTAGQASGTGERTLCPALCVVLDGVGNGERLDDARSIIAHVASPDPVAAVAVLLDGEDYRTITAPPYQFNIDPVTLEDGDHTIEVRVLTTGGGATSTDLAFATGPAGSSSSRITYVLAAVLVALLAFAGWFGFKTLKKRTRRRPGSPLAGPLEPVPIDPRRRQAFEGKPLRWPDDPPAHQAVPEDPLGRLVVISGPNQGQSFNISDAPAAIGSGHRCIFRLAEEIGGEEIPPELARFWIREGHLMVHEVSRLTVTGSTGGNWAILNPGETFTVGPCTFRFELLNQAAPAGAPNILRDEPAPEPAPDETPNILRDTPTTGVPPLPEQPPQTQPYPAGQEPLRPHLFPAGQGRVSDYTPPPMPGQGRPLASQLQGSEPDAFEQAPQSGPFSAQPPAGGREPLAWRKTDTGEQPAPGSEQPPFGQQPPEPFTPPQRPAKGDDRRPQPPLPPWQSRSQGEG
jgi:VWFA-related protein